MDRYTSTTAHHNAIQQGDIWFWILGNHIVQGVLMREEAAHRHQALERRCLEEPSCGKFSSYDRRQSPWRVAVRRGNAAPLWSPRMHDCSYDRCRQDREGSVTPCTAAISEGGKHIERDHSQRATGHLGASSRCPAMICWTVAFTSPPAQKACAPPSTSVNCNLQVADC